MEILDKSQAAGNKDLISEALRISQTKEGLAQVVYNHTQVTGSELVKSPAINANTGQVLTRPIHNPVEIFLALYTSKKNEQKEKRERQHELLDKALKDWYYYDNNTPATERYNASLGTFITKDYFIRNPYRCPSSTRCIKPFITEEEAKKHAYIHQVQQR
jgi:hypothetical protein